MRILTIRTPRWTRSGVAMKRAVCNCIQGPINAGFGVLAGKLRGDGFFRAFARKFGRPSEAFALFISKPGTRPKREANVADQIHITVGA